VHVGARVDGAGSATTDLAVGNAGAPQGDAEADRLSHLAEMKDRIAQLQGNIAQLQSIMNGGSPSGSGASAGWTAAQNQATSDLYASGAGDVREYVEPAAPAPITIGPEDLTPLAPLDLSSLIQPIR